MTTDPLLGRLLGGTYGIERILGQGGFGAVYVARHARTGKHYAVKVLRPDRGGVSDDVRTRFRREAETLAALGHPGIVAIHDFAATDDGVEYLVMDLLEGEDLSQRLERVGRMPLDASMALMQQLASALGAAHARGIMHRDLKPANIFLKQVPGEGERVMILDFGLAKMMDEATEERLTASGVAMGTPQYMSPEQASGAPLDHRTDIYAAASIFYECVSGQPPFLAPTMSALMVKILTAPPPPLSTLVPVPAHIDRALSRALAKDQLERFSSIADLAAALQGLEPVTAETRPGMAVTPVPMTRELQAAQAAALSLLNPAGQPATAASTGPLLPPSEAGTPPSGSGPAETPQAWSVAGGATPQGTPAAGGARGILFGAAGMLALFLAVVAGGGIVYFLTRPSAPPETHASATTAAEVTPVPEPLPALHHAPTIDEPQAPTSGGPEDEASVADTEPATDEPAQGGVATPRGRRPRNGGGGGEAAAAAVAAPTTPANAAAAGVPVAAAPGAAHLSEAQRSAYRAQIAGFEAKNAAMAALIQRLRSLRPMVTGMAEARRPRLCDGPGVRAMSERSDIPEIVSAQQRVRDQIERACAPFENIAHPPPEVRSDFDRIARTLDRAEEMTRATVSTNEPRQIADEIRAAIGQTRTALAGVAEGRRTFPCDAPVFSRLRELKDAGNRYSGTAAGNVVRLRDNICRRLGIDRQSLRRGEAQLLEYLDLTEAGLRTSQRANQQAIDNLRPWAG